MTVTQRIMKWAADQGMDAKIVDIYGESSSFLVHVNSPSTNGSVVFEKVYPVNGEVILRVSATTLGDEVNDLELSLEEKNAPSMTVWKFPIEITKRQTVKLPKGARPISVGIQHYAGEVLTTKKEGTTERAVLWALVNPFASESEHVYVHMIATGHEVPEPQRAKIGRFLGTLIRSDGTVIDHVFLDVDAE